MRCIGQAGRQRVAGILAVIVATIGSSLASLPGASAATGDVTSFPIPAGGAKPAAIARAADGQMWLALQEGAPLATVATSGSVALRPVAGLASDALPTGIVGGPDARLWFTDTKANAVMSVTTQGTDLRKYPLSTAAASPGAITVGPDGALWFTEVTGNRIGRISTVGAITEYPLPAGAEPRGIVTGPDKHLWFTMTGKDSIGRLSTTGTLQVFPLPSAGSRPYGITVGGDGNLWFTESGGNRIGRISTTGALAEFTVPTADSVPLAVTTGADGSVWFTQLQARKVARIDATGAFVEYWLPAGPSEPVAIASGSDGNIWVAEQGVNRITRVLTGVVPAATKAPVIEGPSAAIGATVKATTGEWAFEPTSFAYQWQRCTTAEAGSCTDIVGATKGDLTVTADLADAWLRVLVRATNLNGQSAQASASALLKSGSKPIPAAVTGGIKVAIAPGTTATVRAVNRTKRGVLRKFRVVFNSAEVRGKVRMSLVNAYGQEVRVITKGKWAVPDGPDVAISARWWRISKKIAPGSYTIRAVFTPNPAQASTYAAATLTRTIVLR